MTFSLWPSATTTVSGFAPLTPAGRSQRIGTLQSPWHLHTQHQDHNQVPPNEFAGKKRIAPSGGKPAVPIKQKAGQSKGMMRLQHLATTTEHASLLALADPAVAPMSGGRMGGSFSPSRLTPSPRAIDSPNFSPLIPFGVGVISLCRGLAINNVLWSFNIAYIVQFIVTSVLANRPIDVGTSALGTGTSVVQLSVVVDVPNRDDPCSLLSVLDRLAQSSKTWSREGVQKLTSQVALELLRRKSSIQAAASRYQYVKKEREGQRLFDLSSVRERSKFVTETVSNFDGIEVSPSSLGHRSRSGDASDGMATMMVVTLVLSIQGDSTKVSKIGSLADVEDALQRIAIDTKVDKCLTCAEILWTPQDRSETLSRQDVVVAYPELTTV